MRPLPDGATILSFDAGRRAAPAMDAARLAAPGRAEVIIFPRTGLVALLVGQGAAVPAGPRRAAEPGWSTRRSDCNAI